MAALSTLLPWNLAANRWAAQLNPLLANPLNSGIILSNITLKVGNNVINTTLGKMQKGWIITDINGVSSIYRSAPFNNLTLTLNSSAAVVVSLVVF